MVLYEGLMKVLLTESQSGVISQREMLIFDRTRPMAARAIFMGPNQKALARR